MQFLDDKIVEKLKNEIEDYDQKIEKLSSEIEKSDNS